MAGVEREQRVGGVDGCPAGWVLVTANAWPGRLAGLEVQVLPDFPALLDATSFCAAVAVDIPIGLSEDGRRLADSLARRCLGPRRSSVFPPPPRFTLEMDDYWQANRTSKAQFGRGLQRQTFNITPKIRDADRCLTPALQDRVVEAHPEVSFWALAGSRPMAHPKRRPEGRAERLLLLESVLGPEVRGLSPPRGAAWDDLYDACALIWTASRVAAGTAVHLPAVAQRDARGLRMEIVY
jgi:predicted RNase H-like nuclease